MTVMEQAPVLCPPRYSTPRNPEHRTLGPGVDLLAQQVWGVGLYPWQQQVVDTALEVDADGRWVHRVVVVTVPRRAGKTRLTQAVGLHRAASKPGAFSWMTAQDQKSAAEKFRLELLPQLQASALGPHLSARTAAGSERVTVNGRGTLKLFAPSPEAMHGFDADAVVIDEAWAFTMERGQQLETAAMPTGLTRAGQFQFWIVSAGGDESSTWLDHWMTLGRAGTAGVCYFEWGADPDAPDYDYTSLETLLKAHPSVADGAIPASAVLEQLHTMGREGYERSYLGVWPRPSEQAQYRLDPDRWAACSDDLATADSCPVVAIGVEIAPDLSAASVVAAGRDGLAVTLEVIQAAPGTAWIGPLLEQLHRARPKVPLVMDSLTAASVVAELKRTRVPVTTTGSTDMARACHVIADLVNTGQLTHRPHHDLDVAVRKSGRRKLGDGWAWARTTSLDNSALVAATLAVWGAMTTEAPSRPSIATAG